MVTNQISWLIPHQRAYAGLQAFKETGKAVLVIDPVRTESCDYFEDRAEWIAPKPQTDLVIMLGIAHTLHDEGLHDAAFLVDCTSGFDRFVPYLTGENNGTSKDADWAADISGIDADVIRDLVRRFAGGTTVLGQIDLPGGGLGLS